MEVIQMTSENMWSFLDWAGGVFECSGSITMQLENAERYPSLKEEGMPSLRGMAKLCAKYNLQWDKRTSIPIM